MLSRRDFLSKGKTILAAGGAALTGHLQQAFAADSLTTDSIRRQGAPASDYGKRSPLVNSLRKVLTLGHPGTSASFTPLQDLHGTTTPSALHFERHHGGVPNIDHDTHHLLIHGLVDLPLLFTMSELLRLPSRSATYFIECSGNGISEWNGPKGRTVQETHGLTSCSEWTGVPLTTLLAKTGLAPDARWILAEGADGAAMTRSLPLTKANDDVLIVYAQNGEPLRPEQGYPLRLLVPGWEGNINIKWLRRLKIVDRPYQTREETSMYTDLMADGTAHQFTFVMGPKSVITYPSGGHRLATAGFYEIRGLAWSGHGRVKRVEISTDNGATWQLANLHGLVQDKCHTRFTFGWQWQGQPTTILSRCVDEKGNQQPTREQLHAARGTVPSYHNNSIQRWQIDITGHVLNA
jgi:sulfane dehydrogenase subunit SoxC